MKIVLQSHGETRRVDIETLRVEQKAQKEDRFLRGRQIAFTINDYFRVTGARDTVFSITLIYSLSLIMTTMFRISIQDGTRFQLSMTKIQSDDLLDSLCKLRIRGSDQLKKLY